jgi:DNA-binding transcriptional LysR family regulator
MAYSYLFGIMIDIRQMRYFVTLAETLHFGRAAEQLHITQPPLSRQITALEKELGVKLLERHSRRAGLTRAGQQFLGDARAALLAFDTACRNAKFADKGEIGELSIGFTMHPAYTVMPSLTRQFMAAYPKVDVKLREIAPDNLADDTLSGQFDVALAFAPGPMTGLEIQPIVRERLCLALPQNHPLAKRSSIDAHQLKNEPLIVTPAQATPSLRKAISDYCGEAGFAPTIRLETLFQQTIVSLVAETLGVAIVPESMKRLGIPGVVFRPLKKAPEVDHVVAWRADNLNPTLRPFLNIARAFRRQSKASG